MPGSLKYVSEIIAKHGDEIKNHSAYRLGHGLPYGKKFETNALGFRMNVHLFYDNEKALKEIGSLYELIDSQEDDLKNMQEPPGWVRWLDLFFHYFSH